jgi:small subunit ribosomal protein S20
MANLKSSKKDLRRNEKRRARNLEVRSGLKTYVKKVRTAIASGDATATQSSLSEAMKKLDKAVQRGIIHKNQAARRKSRIAKAAASASKS